MRLGILEVTIDTVLLIRYLRFLFGGHVRIVAMSASQLKIGLQIALAAQQTNRLKAEHVGLVISQLFSRHGVWQSMTRSTKPHLGLGRPIGTTDRKWRRRVRLASLFDMFAAWSVAFFAVHIGDMIDNRLADDLS